MRNKIIAITAAGFLLIIGFIGCQNTGEKNKQNTQDSIMQSKPDSIAQQNKMTDDWNTFKTESEQKIKDNEDSIAVLKEKMNKSGNKIKIKFNKEIAKLEKDNRAMQKKLEEYKNDGKGAWADFKTDFNNEMDKIGKSLKDLTSDDD